MAKHRVQIALTQNGLRLWFQHGIGGEQVAVALDALEAAAAQATFKLVLFLLAYSLNKAVC